MDGIGLWLWALRAYSLEVADMVADVNFSLSTCYSVEQLDDLLDLVQSSQEQLMHTVGFRF